jgi:hypothetical protein
MAAMTHGDTLIGRSDQEESALRLSIILVVGLVLVHLAMAYSYPTLPDQVFDLVNRLSGKELALILVDQVPTLPLAVVVVLWARTRRLGWIGCAVVLAVGLLPYMRDVVVRQLFDAGQPDAGISFLDRSTWVLTGLVPLGAALAWGIARRTGTGWWPGLVLAALLALLFRALDIDAFDDPSWRPVFLAFVYHVVPAVLAGLACWWLEVRRAAS